MIEHHIGIIVKNIDKSIQMYKKLGYNQISDITIDTIQNNRITFLQNSANRRIELIEAMDQNSSVYNFDVGYHHICYDVSHMVLFEEYFKELKIGKIFTSHTIAPAINNRTIVFAILHNGSFIEFILNR